MNVIFYRTNTLGNLSSAHFLIAHVSGQSLEATVNHLRCQSRSSWSTTFLFIKSSSYSFKIGEMQTFSLIYSEHKTDGVKMNKLVPLHLNFLKRCAISEKKWVNNWYNKSSFIILFRRIDSGKARFNFRLICHTQRLFQNYIVLLVNIHFSMHQ